MKQRPTKINRNGKAGLNRNGKAGKDRLKGSLGRDVLFGAAGDDTLFGLEGKDLLKGGDGNDILDGGLGRDKLIGGRGDDTYFVDDLGDRITELGGRNQGIDTVNAAVSWVLGNNLENLVLGGTAAINGTGNQLDNSLTGNVANNVLDGAAGTDLLTGGEGDDTLIGGSGDDTLTGGNGIDQFVYSTGKEFTTLEVGIDTITDFVAGTDKIVLSKATFGAVTSIAGNGFSAVTDFSTVATDAEVGLSTGLIVFSAESKGVFYNQNGAVDGLGTGAKFAAVSNATSLAASDFVVQV